MYEGHLQHDAQEVLQCILGYIQEACDTIRKEQGSEKKGDDVREAKTENASTVSSCSEAESKPSTDEDGQVSVKRKSDTEVGNAKKKPKSVKSKKSGSVEENVCRNVPFTRSKRKSSSDVTAEHKDKEEKKVNKEEGNGKEGKNEKVSKETDGKVKKRAKLGWLRPSGKQPSIFSKFCSVGKISSITVKNEKKAELENKLQDEPNDETGQEMATGNSTDNTEKHQGMSQGMGWADKRLDFC